MGSVANGNTPTGYTNGDAKRLRWTLDLTFANMVQIVILLVSVVYFGARVEAHLGDSQRHQSAEEKSRAFDDRFALRVEPLMIQIRQLREEIEDLRDAIRRDTERHERQLERGAK